MPVLLSSISLFGKALFYTQFGMASIFASDSRQRTWNEMYGQLISLLYTTSFIGLARGSQGKPLYSYNDPTPTELAASLPENIYFVIHPAFRQGLNAVEKREGLS